MADNSSEKSISPPNSHPNSPNRRVFADINVNEFISDARNVNTSKKTATDIGVLTTFLKEKHEIRNIETIEPEMLNDYLASF